MSDYKIDSQVKTLSPLALITDDIDKMNAWFDGYKAAYCEKLDPKHPIQFFIDPTDTDTDSFEIVLGIEGKNDYDAWDIFTDFCRTFMRRDTEVWVLDTLCMENCLLKMMLKKITIDAEYNRLIIIETPVSSALKRYIQTDPNI